MALAAMAAWSPSAEATTPRTFEAGKGTFLLDGKPYLLKSAELHYPRIPREYSGKPHPAMPGAGHEHGVPLRVLECA